MDWSQLLKTDVNWHSNNSQISS